MIFESSEQLEQWLVHALSDKTDIPLEELLPTMSFAALGIDSVESVGLAADLDENIPEFTVQPSLFWEVDSVRELAQELFGKISEMRLATAE